MPVAHAVIDAERPDPRPGQARMGRWLSRLMTHWIFSGIGSMLAKARCRTIRGELASGRERSGC